MLNYTKVCSVFEIILEYFKLSHSCCFIDLEPELFEGDIVMTRSLETDMSNMEYAAKNNVSKFDAISNRAWTRRTIPYTFSRGFSEYFSQ